MTSGTAPSRRPAWLDRPTEPMELQAEPARIPTGEAVELPPREGLRWFVQALAAWKARLAR